jgi:hypothetical protein
MLQSQLPLHPKPRRKPPGRAGSARLRGANRARTLADRTADLEQAQVHARQARALLRRAGAPQSHRKAHRLCKSIEGAQRHLTSIVYRELAAATKAPATPPAVLGSACNDHASDPDAPQRDAASEPRAGPPTPGRSPDRDRQPHPTAAVPQHPLRGGTCP